MFHDDLLASDERIKFILGSAGLGTWDWDLGSGKITWSSRCIEMFGIPVGTTITYDRFLDAVHPDDRARVDTAVKQSLSLKQDYSIEMRSVWPDGSIHWIASRGRPYFNETGEAVRMTGAALDVTRIKETEEELLYAKAEAKAQAANLSAVFDAVPAAAFFSHDRKCERITSNRAAYELLRVPYGLNTSKSAAIEERPTFRVFENGRELAAEELPLQKAAATGEQVRNKELEIRFPDGTSTWEFGHAVPLFDGQGNVSGAVGAFLDITDRRVIEERLHAATDRFRIALRGTPITVFNQGLDLRYRWVHNPIGIHDAIEIIGKRDSDLLEREEDWRMSEAIKSEVLRTGVSYQGDMIVSMHGANRHYHVKLDAQRDAQGRIIGLTGATFDLTESKLAEAEREQLSRQRQLALDAAAMGWWRYDAATGACTWDDTFRTIFGLTSNSLPAREVLKRVHPEDAARMSAECEVAFAGAHPKAHFGEYRVSLEDGSERWVELYAAAEVDRSLGTFVSCYGTVREISERKATELALRESEARYRELAANLDLEVQERTRELQWRNEEVLRTSEAVRMLSSRLMQSQDQERRRIARDLHDSSGQILTAIGLDLANVAEQVQAEKIREIAPELAEPLQEAQELVQKLHRELRTTSYLLHPPLLEEAGLSSAVAWYVQGAAQRSGLDIQLDIASNVGRLARDLELAVFRVVQESLTNILRHSGSKRAAIRMWRETGEVTLEIQDEGKGIPAEQLAEVQSGMSGFGIRAMRERLHPFGGELQIESREGATRVVVKIPLRDSEAKVESGTEPARAAM